MDDYTKPAFRVINPTPYFGHYYGEFFFLDTISDQEVSGKSFLENGSRRFARQDVEIISRPEAYQAGDPVEVITSGLYDTGKRGLIIESVDRFWVMIKNPENCVTKYHFWHLRPMKPAEGKAGAPIQLSLF